MFDLQKSPIRKNIARVKEGQLTIFESEDLFEGGRNPEHIKKYQVRTILKDVENMLETMEGNKDKQVKIAILGEVKAGKSTFINACVEKEVAYTDILEATAIVSEITYSKEEYARVLDKSGQIVMECSFEELMEWTAKKVDNMEDFAEFDKIQIGVPNNMLEDIVLVDTPGLLSITTENHEITSDYIAQTDYILWVIDSTNLGAKDVNDYIDKVKLSGKPMIGIVNKVDSEAVRMEIKDYVQREYGNIFEEIYFVSSYKAWELQKENDIRWDEKSGFDEVIECIEDLACDKEYSSGKTQFHQLQREKEIHRKMEAVIRHRKQYYDRELENFALINNEIRKVLLEETGSWIKNEFYMEEKRKLLEAKGDKFTELIEKYNGAEYYTKVINEKYEEMAAYIYRKWQIVINGIKNSSSEVIVDFKYDGNIDFAGAEGMTQEDIDEITAKGMEDGLKKGAMMGLAFAGYSAWLGPVAETVTLASEVVPAVVPLALVGCAVGALVSRSHIDTAEAEKNEKKKQEYIEGLYNEAIRVVKIEMRKRIQELYKNTDYYYNQRCTEYKNMAKAANFDFTEPAYGQFMNELEVYIEAVEKALKTEDENVLQKPPAIEE